MVFSNKQKPRHNINIEIDQKKIIKCSKTTFLGITIDANLSWKSHIHNVCSKLARCTGGGDSDDDDNVDDDDDDNGNDDDNDDDNTVI